MRAALPWALTAALGLVVAGSAIPWGDRGRFAFFRGDDGAGRARLSPSSLPGNGAADEAEPPSVSHEAVHEREKPSAEVADSTADSIADSNVDSTGAADRAPAAAADAEAAPASGPEAPSSADVEAWLDAVVSLETGPAENRERLGAGLLVSEEGDVLTCLHVVRGLRSVTVLLRDGAAYEAAGYAAVDEKRDLALLRLDRPPRGATVFPVERIAKPARLQPIVALGHPEGSSFAAFEGAVSNVLLPDDLPVRSRRFLENELGAGDDVVWVQHTARLFPGCSGGPLLSGSGELLGTNAWTDDQTGLGYAVAAAHVEDLLALARAQGSVEPIAEVAARQVDWRRLERNLSAENVERTMAAAESFDWRPQSEDDYRTLRELAALVTFANQTSHALRSQSGLEESVVQDLRTASDVAETTLRGKRWDPLVQLALVNEGAERTLDEPQGGCFLFVTAVESFVGPSGASGFLGELTGGERRVFLRTDSLLESPAAGSHWLALAIRQRGETVRFGDNPLDPEVVPQLRVGVLIPLQLP